MQKFFNQNRDVCRIISFKLDEPQTQILLRTNFESVVELLGRPYIFLLKILPEQAKLSTRRIAEKQAAIDGHHPRRNSVDNLYHTLRRIPVGTAHRVCSYPTIAVITVFLKKRMALGCVFTINEVQAQRNDIGPFHACTNVQSDTHGVPPKAGSELSPQNLSQKASRVNYSFDDLACFLYSIFD